MATSLTQTDVANLEAAIASGELQVRKGDRWITYRSIEELQAALAYARQQIASAADTPPPRAYVLGVERGVS